MANATTNISIRFTNHTRSNAPYTTTKMVAGTDYKISPNGSTARENNYVFGKISIPDAIRHRPLVGFTVTMSVKNVRSDFSPLIWVTEDYDENTLNYNNQPGSVTQLVSIETTDDSGSYINITSDYTDHPINLERLKTLCQTRALFVYSGPYSYLSNSGGYTRTTLKNGSTLPYVTVTYDNSVYITSKIVYRSGPASGYSNPRNATTFTWDYVKANASEYCADEHWDQSSAVFHWKASGSQSYTDISISGNVKSVTIPANTFPTGSTIQWYVTGTDEDGTTTQTPVYSFSTAAGDVSTSCIDPVGQVIDGSADYTFRWSIASTDGQPASRTILQWKPSSGNTWSNVFDINSALTSYVVPGGTFLPGPIDWRVLAYNIDGALGSAATATFISVAAPDAVQGLAATAVPFSTITWQSRGQEAYQITIDGEVVAKEYGPTVYSYKLKEPLADGDHTISVMVQGVYELWSQPSEITVSIHNEPTAPINLTGTFGIDASLSWDLVQDLTYIYRDGKRIGATNGQNFTDRLSIGRHDYYVLGPLPDGNYNISNTVTGTTEVDCGQISLLSGDGWLPLKHCKELPVQTYTHSRTVSVRHYCGATYPVAEVSEFYDRSGSFNVLFEESEAAILEMFEELLGEIVIMKNRRNNILVGLFSTLDKRVEDFYTDCDFIVQQTEWNDFVNETNN
jgi:hypothetical protein